MKPRNLILACSLSATLLSFNAFAQDASVCSNPLQKVCVDTAPQRVQRAAYIKRLKEEIAAEAKIAAAPRIEAMKKSISVIHFLKRFIATYKINNQEIMKAAKKRVGSLESIVTNPQTAALLKAYMSIAINESKFDPSVKADLQGIMQTVVVGNFADYIEKSGLEDNALGQLLNNGCGSDGLVENAFATTINKQRYVLICPGFLITLTQSANDTEKFNSMLQAISHEMGHHIDNSVVGNELYRPYLSCLAQNYSSQFNSTSEDKKFCKKNEKDPAACRMKVTESHAGELIADQWGLKVLGIHARTQSYSFADTEKMLVNTWTNLCGTGDEGIHPTGDFRIGTLLRKDPEVSTYLACDNRDINSKPSCTFDGPVSI